MENIKKIYNDQNAERSVFLGRIVFVFMLFTLPFFIYLDFFILKLDSRILYLRALPIAAGLIFFITALIVKKRTGYLFIVLYGIMLSSITVMMLGLAFITQHTALFHDSIIAVIIVILLTAVVSMRGMVFLIPVMGIPLAVFIVIVSTGKNRELEHMVALTNPVILAAGFIILAEIAERSRFKNFTSMKTIEYQTLELIEKNRLIEEKNSIFEKELSLARLVQKSLLPVAVPSFAGLKTSLVYHPMREVGGDLYDFIYFPDNKKSGIFISDISGHGISAAIMSSMVKTLLVTSGPERMTPSVLLAYLNSKLTGMLADNFLTAFYGIYDPDSGTFTFARGGHEYPLLIKTDGSVIQLKSKGGLIGIECSRTFQDYTIPVSTGDKILLFTDGLTEARDEYGLMFEEVMINEIIPSIVSETVENFVNIIYKAVVNFKKNEPFEDDICIICFEITG